MLIISEVVLFIVFFSGSALFAQASASERQPYGFRDVHIGMSAAAFKVKHPAPKTKCILGTGQVMGTHPSTPAVTRCDYQESDYDVPVRVSAMLVDGRIALIEVEPPLDTYSCFEGSPPPGNFCEMYLKLMEDMAGSLGPARQMIPAKAGMENFRARRWESDSSVAEFQAHMCGPWDGTDGGWSKVISSILDGDYCAQNDTVSIRQPVMFYVAKESGRTLSSRLAK